MQWDKQLTIRSLTIGLPWDRLGPENWLLAKSFVDLAERLCSKKGILIRTKRLVLPLLTPDIGITAVQLRSLIHNVAERGKESGFRWICVPISGQDGWQGEDLRKVAPSLVREETCLFIHFLFNKYDLPDHDALLSIGEQILAISRISNNGFDNFRVGVGFNIIPGTPFFPFSWHEGGCSFSFAVESLQPILSSLQTSSVLLKETLSCLCATINELGMELARESEGCFFYRGQDISLAPYPNDTDSIAVLMKRLGLENFGLAGTASLTAKLTNLLKSTIHECGVRSVGFNGVMFSPLEDMGVSHSIAEHGLSMDSFMLWSTLCGCGVDMVPVPGNVDARTIGALYADVATLSRQHGKPLGVRILPIPNRRVNQMTQFNHDFLVNTPIVDIRGGFSHI